ncbi:outer membrane beta-barrel family protein [Chitinophaga nivalis]|uniref:TonB-dependent receptor family protein n=1 Tax=Chitinophaga nivalis TaxID=2991709 RepID=A0ABT3IK55_9BACT|nr:outer membrane beta-barrel family protein [Chitinophaga nivalis]MCW3465975.1 TonB-dependent receptor family protein [Chitinophaga nivalis]MCW3484334.1 TonB-dependent receptor family protein [Chitinophaga nivalis]
MTKFSMAFCLLICLSFLATAQKTIKGKILDNQTRQPLGYAMVSLLSPDSTFITGQMTDTAGIFRLSNLQNGRYTLLLSSFGYSKFYQDVILDNTGGSNLDLGTIALTTISSQLNEVIVTGEKPMLQRQADKLILNVSGNPLFAASANTFDILKKIPGLQINADGSLQMTGGSAPAIFIDGKQVPMSPEELQNYLAGLTPEMIASVEIINNPSSKYNGEHKSIIDIRLKRDRTLGWKGNISSNIQQNAYTLADNNLLLTYKTKKLSYTARLGYTAGTSIYRYSALQHLANTNIMATQNNTPTNNNNFNYQLGIDYNFSKTHHIEIIGRTYQSNRHVNSFNTLHTTAAAKQPVSDIYTFNNTSPRQQTYAVHLNYNGKPGKSQLEILSSFLKISNRQNEDIQTKNLDGHRLLNYWKTDLKNDILIRSVQADLSGNPGKGKWSTGARFAVTTTNNQLRYDTLNTLSAFVPDSSRSNSFQYDEYVTAAYVAYERTINKWSYSASLRAEHTHSNAITQHLLTSRDYLTWLPSFSVTFPLEHAQQLHVSYSRRITRPNFAQLNPFRFYNSPLNYFVGNPYLQPSKTDMLSLAYNRHDLSVTLFAGRETDPMGRYPEYNPVTNVLEYLGRNLPYNDFGGIEVSLPLTINRWWNMNNNIRGKYKKEVTPYHDKVYAIPIFDYTLSGSQVFSLPKGITFDISYLYQSASGNGLYTFKPMGSLDLGIRKSWLKGKLNSRFNFYDVFDTYRYHLTFREKMIINNQLQHRYGNHKIALTLNYSFGKSTHTSKGESKNDEERRAGM